MTYTTEIHWVQLNLSQRFTAKAMALEDSSDHHSHLRFHGQRVELILSVTNAILPYTLWPCRFLFGFVPFPPSPCVRVFKTCTEQTLVLQATSFTSGHRKERTPGPDSQGKVVRFDNFENCNCRTKTKRFMILWYFMIVYSVYIMYDCLWMFMTFCRGTFNFKNLNSEGSLAEGSVEAQHGSAAQNWMCLPAWHAHVCDTYSLTKETVHSVHQWTRRGFLDSVQTNLGFRSYSLFCVLWNETCHCCARQVEKEDSIESLWKSLAQAVGL